MAIKRRTPLARPTPIPPAERCKRSRCTRRRIEDGLCLPHLKKNGKSRFGVALKRDAGGKVSARSAVEGRRKALLKLADGVPGSGVHELMTEVRFELCTEPRPGSVDRTSFVRCSKLGVNVHRRASVVEAYYADCVYVSDRHALAGFIVEDTKGGMLTPDYRRKERWMGDHGWPVLRATEDARGRWEVRGHTPHSGPATPPGRGRRPRAAPAPRGAATPG